MSQLHSLKRVYLSAQNRRSVTPKVGVGRPAARRAPCLGRGARWDAPPRSFSAAFPAAAHGLRVRPPAVPPRTGPLRPSREAALGKGKPDQYPAAGQGGRVGLRGERCGDESATRHPPGRLSRSPRGPAVPTRAFSRPERVPSPTRSPLPSAESRLVPASPCNAGLTDPRGMQYMMVMGNSPDCSLVSRVCRFLPEYEKCISPGARSRLFLRLIVFG